ncbi:efflux RND transporter permease subunit [Sporomusa termitida]|uniref:Swarming motility protein SwrC n=1 Tax=Sporomusa termitida TaxID=2377 RepID=A0A517DP04_9FIRM|nr:efflux RND transporter permease subunit [Sporomusa termitida]QDR79091.1 Swarming motility protein SwrC [Sporomusa termitida]
MNITRFSIQRPVGITMIVLLFVVLGLYSFLRIGVELLPALNNPYVTVTVDYAGASVEEMEESVVKPLEQGLSSLAHLRRMVAIARPEKATVILEFDLMANVDVVSIDASKAVSRVRKNLPDEINEPVVIRRDANAMPVMEIAVKAKYDLADIYGKADQVFKERLQRADGVAEVTLGGGREKELAVLVERDKLVLYKLTLAQFVNRLKEENLLMPAGLVYTDNTESDVRLAARYTSPAEIRRLYVANAAGAAVPLTEIAEVSAQDSRPTQYSRVNGDEAVALQIYKNSDANIVRTVQAVQEQLASLRDEYPDYQFIVVANDATYIDNSLKNTLTTLGEGIITTGLVLFLFLRGWRSTVAVMVAIPTSLIATFLVMYLAGFTFNMMSLMGMALCIGILVDDSIVVLENIHRHLLMGEPAALAAENGRNEIGLAAIAITLCDVVVFLPIAFMTDITGQYFRQFALTIVFATLFSLFISFTLTPMLAARLYSDRKTRGNAALWLYMDRLEQTAIAGYERLLRWSLAHGRQIAAAIFILLTATVALIPAGIIGAEYMPRTDESSFRVNVELPVGQNLEMTDAVVAELEQYILTIPEVTYCLSYVGESNSNTARLTGQLVNKRERSRSVWQITDQIRDFARQNLGQASVRIAETESSVAGVSMGGSLEHSPVLIYLLGANMEDLIEASNKAQTLLGGISGLKDIRSNYRVGVPEYKLTVDREKMKFFHTSVNEVREAFAGAINGKKAGVLANDRHNNGRDTDIVVRLKGSDSFKAADLGVIPVKTAGNTVFLGDIARIEEGVGPTAITRVNKQRSVLVQASITDRPLKEVLAEIDRQFKHEPLATGVTYRFGGQATNMDSSYHEIIQALVLSLLLVYMLLAVLYESAFTPVIRMLSLPLGLIGALLFLLFTHNTINVYSLIGFLVMDGLVAKNGTLLLDYTLTLMGRGLSAYDALIEAGKARFKPICMTTLTMVVGMLPTALALNEGAETRVSMAWVLIGGLLSSTVFTLIVIPIVFLFCERHPVRTWPAGAIGCVKKLAGYN